MKRTKKTSSPSSSPQTVFITPVGNGRATFRVDDTKPTYTHRKQNNKRNKELLAVEAQYERLMNLEQEALTEPSIQSCVNNLRRMIAFLQTSEAENMCGKLEAARIVGSYANKIGQLYLKANNKLAAFEAFNEACRSPELFPLINLYNVAQKLNDPEKIAHAADLLFLKGTNAVFTFIDPSEWLNILATLTSYYVSRKEYSLLIEKLCAICQRETLATSWLTASTLMTLAKFFKNQFSRALLPKIYQIMLILPQLASNDSEKVQAFEMLGIAFAKAEYGAKKDIKQALDYFQQAAKLGSAEAMVEIGTLHRTGRDIKKDLKLAILWYEKAIKQNYFRAGIELIRLHLFCSDAKMVEQWQENINKAKIALEKLKQQFAAGSASKVNKPIQDTLLLIEAVILKCSKLRTIPDLAQEVENNGKGYILFASNELTETDTQSIIQALEQIIQIKSIPQVELLALIHLASIYADPINPAYDTMLAETYFTHSIEILSTLDDKDDEYVDLKQTVESALDQIQAAKAPVQTDATFDNTQSPSTPVDQEMKSFASDSPIADQDAQNDETSDDEKIDDDEWARRLALLSEPTLSAIAPQAKLATVLKANAEIKLKMTFEIDPTPINRERSSFFGKIRTLLKRLTDENPLPYHQLMQILIDVTYELGQIKQSIGVLFGEIPLFIRLSQRIAQQIEQDLLEPSQQHSSSIHKRTFIALSHVRKWQLRSATDAFIPAILQTRWFQFNFKSLAQAILTLGFCDFHPDILRAILPGAIHHTHQLLIYPHVPKTADDCAALCYGFALIDASLNLPKNHGLFSLSYQVLILKLLTLANQDDISHLPDFHLASLYFQQKYPLKGKYSDRHGEHHQQIVAKQPPKASSTTHSNIMKAIQQEYGQAIKGQTLIEPLGLFVDFYQPKTNTAALLLTNFDYYHQDSGASGAKIPRRKLQTAVLSALPLQVKELTFYHWSIYKVSRDSRQSYFETLFGKVLSNDNSVVTNSETEQKEFSTPTPISTAIASASSVPPSKRVDYRKLLAKLKAEQHAEIASQPQNVPSLPTAASIATNVIDEDDECELKPESSTLYRRYSHVLHLVRVNDANPVLFTDSKSIGPYIDNSWGAMDNRPRVFTYKVFLDFSHWGWGKEADGVFLRFVRIIPYHFVIEGKVKELGENIYKLYDKWHADMLNRDRVRCAFLSGLNPDSGPISPRTGERQDSNPYKFFVTHPLYDHKGNLVKEIFKFLLPVATKGLRPKAP